MRTPPQYAPGNNKPITNFGRAYHWKPTGLPAKRLCFDVRSANRSQAASIWRKAQGLVVMVRSAKASHFPKKKIGVTGHNVDLGLTIKPHA